jgi:lipoprotein Spr
VREFAHRFDAVSNDLQLTKKIHIQKVKLGTIFPQPFLALYLLSLPLANIRNNHVSVTIVMKNLFILSTILFLAASCRSSRPLASQKPASSAEKKGSVEFIDNISIGPGSNENKTGRETTALNTDRKGSFSSSSIENFSSLQFKYAILTNAPVEQMNNEKLLSFMEEWYGARYHYGGNSKEGVDCSAFASLLMNRVYDVSNLPRISKDQYNESRHIRQDELEEGDLVFFHTSGKQKTVTHVGVYLCNNKFIHASTSGVMISDMGQGYYAQRFIGAGRVRD